MATPTTAGLIVLKQPRTGSTWLKAELNALPGVFLRFEPLSDTRFNTSHPLRFGRSAPGRDPCGERLPRPGLLDRSLPAAL